MRTNQRNVCWLVHKYRMGGQWDLTIKVWTLCAQCPNTSTKIYPDPKIHNTIEWQAIFTIESHSPAIYRNCLKCVDAMRCGLGSRFMPIECNDYRNIFLSHWPDSAFFSFRFCFCCYYFSHSHTPNSIGDISEIVAQKCLRQHSQQFSIELFIKYAGRLYSSLYSIFNYGIWSSDYKIKSSTRINDRITDFFLFLIAPFSFQLRAARSLFTFKSATIRNKLPEKKSLHTYWLGCVAYRPKWTKLLYYRWWFFTKLYPLFSCLLSAPFTLFLSLYVFINIHLYNIFVPFILLFGNDLAIQFALKVNSKCAKYIFWLNILVFAIFSNLFSNNKFIN